MLIDLHSRLVEEKHKEREERQPQRAPELAKIATGRWRCQPSDGCFVWSVCIQGFDIYDPVTFTEM